MDSKFQKCQIFCITRFATDIITSWLKDELAKVQLHVPHSVLVEKLTGDNTRAEKERVMHAFKEGVCQVLVSTDVAGMGVDVRGLNFAVNVGVPKTPWKFQQQVGRIGRDGEKSLCITLVFPQKGSQAPEPLLRKIMKGTGCQRKALNDLFVLTDPFIDYTKQIDVLECTDECANMKACQCSACGCCTGCSDVCQCQFSSKVNNRVLENILGLGDEKYRYSFDCEYFFFINFL